jgi:diguanylate cyclase (GGDEF)-like protein
MEIKFYLYMIKRSWWVVVLTALSAVMAALISAYFATPVYSSSARYLVSPNPNFIGGEVDYNLIYSLDTLDKRTIITTYAEVLNSPRIYAETIRQNGLQASDLVNYSHTAVVFPETNIVDLTVTGTDPLLVVDLNYKIGQNAVAYVENLYPVFDMGLLDPPTIPTEPIYPLPMRDAGVALVVGMALGFGLALTRELLRAPIANFVRQSKLDDISQALKGSVFRDNLKEIVHDPKNHFCLCFVRLEGLSDYIDVLPLSTLQNCLRFVTQVLKNQLRGNDLVGRWDSLEYSVLLINTPGRAALNTMERIQAALSVPFNIDISGEVLDLKPVIGISEFCVDDSYTMLTNKAEKALEMAKNSGGIYLHKETD